MSDEILLADGFDDAFIGVGNRYTEPPIAVYDMGKVIDILARDMSVDDAIEYFEYNVAGSWVGKQTPIFVDMKSRESLDAT
jgi:hypothetical protein